MAIASVLVLTAAACTTSVDGAPVPQPLSTQPLSAPPSDGQQTPTRAPLEQRRPVGDALGTYAGLQGRVQRAITERSPLVTDWDWGDPPATVSCSYGDANQGGVSVAMVTWQSPGRVPDAQWPQVVESVTAVATEFEFRSGPPLTDRPGDHAVIFDGPYGATLRIVATTVTTILITSGCHPES